MHIVVATYARLPDGDAEAIRLFTFGELLRDMGNDVYFVGMGFSNYMENKEYRNFQYSSLRKNPYYRLEKIYHYINYKRRLKNFLQLYVRQKKIDVLIIADLPPFVTMWLKKFCVLHGIQLIADSVEWYSPGQFRFGWLSPGMILKNIENKYILDNSVHIISISKYLLNHFESKGCKTVRIPSILDVQNIAYEKQMNEDRLTILYAGSPGKKDYVDLMLKGILLLDETQMNCIQFILAGVSFIDVKHLFTKEELMMLNQCVEFLGRVQRRVVLQKLSAADFTVLLRSPRQRYAKAGFPTKVVESLATATPVILNISSDLGDYIKDMHEGLIVEECSPRAFMETLKRALLLKKDQIETMQYKARLCAEKHFDYRLYKHHLSCLLHTNIPSTNARSQKYKTLTRTLKP